MPHSLCLRSSLFPYPFRYFFLFSDHYFFDFLLRLPCLGVGPERPVGGVRNDSEESHQIASQAVSQEQDRCVLRLNPSWPSLQAKLDQSADPPNGRFPFLYPPSSLWQLYHLLRLYLHAPRHILTLLSFPFLAIHSEPPFVSSSGLPRTRRTNPALPA
ncbi:hypothetical protein ASPSYDRAFT_1089732 [Aspergillus sydowii CBS 593.65]|uniref:Uncharacterized protein n=1 Tax=Aspergillus sydowii CBS 593.65 TaxID=1036612 RepID=A0A1L9TBK1_9EURO|nr:uncharacterized protein ASPSYDRAFT_559583 [Aspergillus sydowii CBS 593.65]XP_040700571.1 uncharacterized protein ASPSYDRAFT_1089732 [Aspergillus sydowii CBS 593.65]OJJ53281.1 hypothetical protein ASPSYDRAFT_559583 [Aspergillus sydowii CBS 593.65]OJJ56765.1 hypothetical protein ASPSYDRAFT_1089732 [Aspergillus sydowii CBS 593.65]